MAAVKRSDRRAFSAVSASMVRYARMISDTTASPLIGVAASCARVFLMLPPSVGTLLCSTAMSSLLLDYFIERVLDAHGLPVDLHPALVVVRERQQRAHRDLALSVL